MAFKDNKYLFCNNEEDLRMYFQFSERNVEDPDEMVCWRLFEKKLDFYEKRHYHNKEISIEEKIKIFEFALYILQFDMAINMFSLPNWGDWYDHVYRNLESCMGVDSNIGSE